MTNSHAKDRSVRYTLSGRIDAENANALRRDLESVFDETASFTLDCQDLTYISSAGLRVLLQLQKRMPERRKIRLDHVAAQVREIFDLSGFTQILDVRSAARKISLDGCRLIGRGGTGECYQTDAESVVKLYYENIPDDLIEREKLGARAAFVAGIPTAISYDMVECGPRRGIIYEMLNARTLSQLVIHSPARIPELGRRYAQLAKILHTTKGDETLFGRWTDDYRALIPRMDFLHDTGKANCRRFLDDLDGADTCVHGDFNPNNIMESDGELLLIDMGEVSVGSPMFDVASLWFTFFYCANPADDEVYPFTGMTGRQQRSLWDAFIREYFQVSDYEEALVCRAEASLIEPLSVLKGMRCALLFPNEFPADWIDRVHRDARALFEKDA